MPSARSISPLNPVCGQHGLDLVPQRFVDNRRVFARIGIAFAVGSESHSGSAQSQLIERSCQIAEELGGHLSGEVKALLMALLCRVEIRSDRVDITLS